MIKTTLPNRRAVSQIVKEYRILAGNSERAATLRAFAALLSEALEGFGRSISYQSVKNWQDGRYMPDGFCMLRLADAARFDWRGDFAGDLLAAIYPDSYAPVSEIGRRAIAAFLMPLTANEGMDGRALGHYSPHQN